MKERFRIICLILLPIISLSCNDEIPTQIDLGLDYYPISTKYQSIYQVSETKYDLLGVSSQTYQLREFISDSIVSSEGLINYILKRETRGDEESEWVQDSFWTLRKNDQNLIQLEDNILFAKLSFPVTSGRFWDGNSYNIMQSQFYSYKIDEDVEMLPDSINDKAIKVIIADVPANLALQDERYEIYVKGIGLVKKNYTVLEFCTTNCESPDQIESGIIFNQILIDYVKK